MHMKPGSHLTSQLLECKSASLRHLSMVLESIGFHNLLPRSQSSHGGTSAYERVPNYCHIGGTSDVLICHLADVGPKTTATS